MTYAFIFTPNAVLLLLVVNVVHEAGRAGSHFESHVFATDGALEVPGIAGSSLKFRHTLVVVYVPTT